MIGTRLLSVTAFALVIVMTLTVLPVSAANGEGTPITIDVTPGTSSIVPINLSIPSGEPGNSFTLTIAGLGQLPLDGTYTGIDPAEDAGPYSARPFIALEKTSVTMNAGERTAIDMTITVPPDARDGGRYAIILVNRTGSVPGQTVAAIPIFLSITEGNDTETGEITALEFTTTGPGDAVQIATWFTNTGNHHFTGAVNTVTIADSNGTVVARAATPPSVQALIPGQEIRFNVSIETDLPDAVYTLTSRMEKQDGSLLAEQRESLPGRDEVAEESPVSESSTPSNTPAERSPGFGVLATVVGIIVWAIFGTFRSRNGEMR